MVCRSSGTGLIFLKRAAHKFAILANSQKRLGTVIVVSSSLLSCVSFSFKDTDVKSKEAQYTAPGQGWAVANPGTADNAFRNSADNSTLSFNSVCDQYQKLSLEELFKNLKNGIENPKELSSESQTVSGFPALSKVLVAQLDGKPFKMGVVVLRTTRCVYDFTLIAKPEFFEKHLEEFHSFTASFREGQSS